MTSRSVCIGLALSILLSLGPTPLMGAISLDFVPVDNSAVLTGYTTYDMQVTTDTDWTAGAMLFQLNAGGFYQHALGTNSVPDTGFFVIDAGLEFDTYLVGATAGGAGDVGGDGYTFGTDELDVSWYNLTPDQVGTTTIARLTLTNDAAGSMSIMLAAAGSETAEFGVEFAPGTGPAVTQVIKEEPEDIKWQAPSLPTYTSSTDWFKLAFPNHYLLSRDLSAYTHPFVAPGTDFWEPRASRADLYGYGKPNVSWLDDTRQLSGRHPLSTLNTFFIPTDEPTLNDPLPEPATLTLIGLGMGAALLRRR